MCFKPWHLPPTKKLRITNDYKMAKVRRPKKPRGSRGLPPSDVTTFSMEKTACDLMVALPKDSETKVQSQLLIQAVMKRLASTGYSHMALTYTIFGKPRPSEDNSESAISSSMWSINVKEPSLKKRKIEVDLAGVETRPAIKVLKRLHAVLENLSDVGSYMMNGPHADLLHQYDLISLAPRNEATFQSACASATASDIITLDYSGSRGLKLPYRIRPADVQAVVDRQAAFEVHFSPALLTPKLRKALVQTCRELQTASLGKKPLVLFSSGDRTVEERDVGDMAFRLPGDLSNLMQVLLRFDPRTSDRAVGPAALEVIQRAEQRRWGKTDVGIVTIGGPDGPRGLDAAPESLMIPGSVQESSEVHENGPEDGFISI
jgi:RNase P subunit p30